jgi:hypothetical protein
MCKLAKPLPIWPDLDDVARFLGELRHMIEAAGAAAELGLGPCIEWAGWTDPAGYGAMIICRGGRQYRVFVHRLSYALFVGELVAGMQVHHRCFNARCVNPNHLELMSHKQNAALKRRHARELPI